MKICIKIVMQIFQVALLSKVKYYWTVIYLNRASLLWKITTLAFENEGRPLPFFRVPSPARLKWTNQVWYNLWHGWWYACKYTLQTHTINNGEANLYVWGIHRDLFLITVHINLFHVYTHNLFHNMSLSFLFDTFYCKLHITQCRKVPYCC